MLYIPIIIALLAAFAWGISDYFKQNAVVDGGGGWIYFISNGEGPIKIGMSRYDPSGERLTELRTMSPVPLHVIYKFKCADRYEMEARVHSYLAAHRLHGEWFDRDATLAFISYLEGEYGS